MNRKPAPLPPLTALRAFEAAARHSSFKEAALELCVTQAAISRQIQQLEAWIDKPLFVRGHRQVSLTDAGETLFQTTYQSFSAIGQTTQQLRQKPPQNASINLYATSSFSRLWLLPRLKALRAQCPGLRLNLITGEENPHMADQFDAGITLGLEEAPGYQADVLFAETIFPICTPAFYQANPQAGTLAGLLTLPLLELAADHWQARWWTPINWQRWLQHCALDNHPSGLSTELTFSHYSTLVDAALQGLGVGLGWHHLVQDMLEDGRLIRPVQAQYQAPTRQHYFVCREDLADQPAIRLLRQWLLEQTAPLRQVHPQ
ncbi:MAG: LysR substrate-binding domain-containing protein [Marinobacterium sp.]|nr:LysR substrate-binding domain-containing protein [Marinobacterium sp.]